MVRAAARDGGDERRILRPQLGADGFIGVAIALELAANRRARFFDLGIHERAGHFLAFLGAGDSASSETKS